MNRREMFRRLGCGAAGIVSGLIWRCSSGRPGPAKHWAWLQSRRTKNPDDWKRLFARLKQGGIQAALISGDPEFLTRLGSAGREEGVEVHVWKITLLNGNRELMKDHPDWYTISRNGLSTRDNPPYVGYYHWLCPINPEVRTYISGKISELASLPDIRGVHLDYIRYPDVILPVGIQPRYNLVQDREYPQFDFCYCPVCRSTFKSKYGIDPLELKNPAASKPWLQFRYDAVARIVKEASSSVHARNKQLTAAVFPSPAIARSLVRQDWASWDVDAIMPMMYHKYYNEDVEWIGKVTEEGVKALGRKIPLYSGLFVGMLKPQELATAARLAMRSGARGIVLFTGHAMNEALWKSLTPVLQSDQA